MKNAIDKRNDLAVERRDNIERLTAKLETCGNCAERQQLSDELQLWKRRDAVIHAAESIAIKQLGLEKYGDVGGIKAAWADYLEHYNVRTPSEKEMIALKDAAWAAHRYCSNLSTAAHEVDVRDRPVSDNRPVWTKCIGENQANDMVFQEKIAYSYCSEDVSRVAAKQVTPVAKHAYFSECLSWNVPTLRLRLLVQRMDTTSPLVKERYAISDWCDYAGGLPETDDPVTGQRDKTKVQEWKIAKQECLAKFNLADLVKQREMAEQECTPPSANDFYRRSFEVVDCLMKKDPLRKMSFETAEAKTIADKAANERLQKRLYDQIYGSKKQ